MQEHITHIRNQQQFENKHTWGTNGLVEEQGIK